MKKKINIAFITDDNYALPTCVALTSLQKNKNIKSVYDVYILYSDVKAEHLEHLQSLSTKNFNVRFIALQNTFDDLEIKNLHVSPISTTKFKLPSILQKLDKILYLDGDVIVQGDLSELYNTDIDDKYAGVVKDMGPMLFYKPDICTRLKISHSCYFNAGVMLLNLKNMRRDNIEDKLLDYRRNGINLFMDQDALNVCFRENVEYISPKYNFIVTLPNRFNENKICEYYEETKENIFQNSTILHFASPYKPWKCYDIDFADIWYSYFQQTPYNTQKFLRISRKSSLCALFNLKKSVIISLTSYPARIDKVHHTIYSLLNQHLLRYKIVLYLGLDKFPNKEKDLPQELLSLRSEKFEIHWVEKDLRSFTKLIPALKEYPEDIVITADDDVLYAPECAERLLLSYIKEPKLIHCHRAHRVLFANGKILPYKQWNREYPVSSTSFNNFLTGVGGVLYPPHCLDNDVFNEEKFMHLCPLADDVWFWAMAVKNNTPIKIIKDGIMKLNIVEGTQQQALWRSNVVENQNDTQLQNVLKEYPEISDKLDKTMSAPQQSPQSIVSKTPAPPKPKKYILTCKFIKHIPLYTYKKRNGNQVWKIFGLPIWRKRKFADNQSVKYYLFGMPLLEIKEKHKY